jgi:fructose-bisphosphate aldolase class II
MPLATLDDVLLPAMRGGYAVAGMVVLGWEDASAFVEAAEAESAPVILQAGPGCRAHTPLPVLAAMFRTLALDATVPVVAHLDHSTSADECRKAVDLGFTSVMFDGSRLSLAENIAQTAAIVRMARAAGVPVEGEVGFVGYDGGEDSRGTEPHDARRFAEETGASALAISVGNVHLQRTEQAVIDFARLRAIESATRTPLVLHGGSGIPEAVRRELATTTRVCKFNVGTEVRMAFGRALRRVLEGDPQVFDRIAILRSTKPAMLDAARRVIRSVGSEGRAALR